MAENTRESVIKIYTTKTCAYCPMVKKFYDGKGVKYQSIDLTEDNRLANEITKKYQTLNVPLIVNDKDEYTTGFNIPKLIHIARNE